MTWALIVVQIEYPNGVHQGGKKWEYCVNLKKSFPPKSKANTLITDSIFRILSTCVVKIWVSS